VVSHRSSHSATERTKNQSHLNNFNSISAPESDYLYTDISQLPNAGKGLYTAIKIYKDETISAFKGEILTQKQIKERVHIDEDKYFIEMLNGKIMDSMHVDCYAKYANDVKGTENSLFKNNARITIDENNDISIVATRTIALGSEIFCSYGREYWLKHK
jgi:uncharacterized protein